MISFMTADGKAAISCNGCIKEIASDMFVVTEALYEEMRKRGENYGYAFLHMMAVNVDVLLKGGDE